MVYLEMFSIGSSCTCQIGYNVLKLTGSFLSLKCFLWYATGVVYMPSAVFNVYKWYYLSKTFWLSCMLMILRFTLWENINEINDKLIYIYAFY